MITKIEINEIPGRCCRINNQVTQEVLDFHNSDWPACEVSIGKYKTIHSAQAAYRQAIKKANVGVTAIEREGRLFLLRK